MIFVIFRRRKILDFFTRKIRLTSKKRCFSRFYGIFLILTAFIGDIKAQARSQNCLQWNGTLNC